MATQAILEQRCVGRHTEPDVIVEGEKFHDARLSDFVEWDDPATRVFADRGGEVQILPRIAGRRPVLLVSPETFNMGPSSLVIVCPLTTTEHRIRTHVRVEPDEGGLKESTFVMTEAVCSIAREHLIRHWGDLRPESMTLVSDRLRILMDL